MVHVQVSSKTYRDNTGRSIDFPTLLVEHNGETMLFEQLHRYQITSVDYQIIPSIEAYFFSKT